MRSGLGLLNIVNNVFLLNNAEERLHLLVRPSKRFTRHVHCKEYYLEATVCLFLSPRRPELTVLSTNQRRGCVAQIFRYPFRLLVSFSVPQRRSNENEGKTSTAQFGSHPLLAMETQSVPHLCEPNRTAPCSGNAA